VHETLTERHLQELVYGGAVLGAGGGGSIEAGLAEGRKALEEGAPRIVQIGELKPDARVATLSVVGSMSRMTPDEPRPLHSPALRRLAALDKRPIAGLIASEVGPQAVTYGWRESAASGIPIVDSPCNGRAHPLALMGSLGLHRRPRYITSTVSIGGNGKGDIGLELALRAPVALASEMVRQAAAQSGVALAVARNPLPAAWVQKNAAVGALSYARNIGRIVLRERSRGPKPLLASLCKGMGGQVLAEGRVSSAVLKEKTGFTVGSVILKDRGGNEFCIAVCNEYLALQKNGGLLASFPDLITLFDTESGVPLGSPEVKAGKRVAIFFVPRQRLRLGSTMNDAGLLRPLERLLNMTLRPRDQEPPHEGTAAEHIARHESSAEVVVAYDR
jgi:DUF917 family protein